MGNKMNKVLPGVYIGSARDAHDVEELRENKISHILSVHENSKPDLPGLEYLCLAVADSPSQNIVCYFSQCNVFIHKARRTGNVLVHCQMGVSRSATIVVAYLMTVTRLSWKDALAALKAVRPFVSPNLGFQKQLMIYEQKYVEEERTRLKALFPLSQFNDVVHCEQLLETYRLSRLRRELPMEVDVYPLALNAYGAKDFASLRRESTPPATAVFCGAVSDPSSEEDCLARRLERIHLTETFTRADTFSCGSRPTPFIIRKTKALEVNTPMDSLDDVQETGSVAWEKISGNALLSGSLNSAVFESGPSDPKSSNDAALEMLFSNSVDVSKNSANDGSKKITMQEPRLQQAESLNDAAVDSIFLNSIGGSKNSVSKERSEAKESSSPEMQVSFQLTDEALREIGRAYLQKQVRIWHDLSGTDEDDEDRKLSAVNIMNNNPSQLNKNNDPTELIKITTRTPAQNKITSSDPIQLIKITSNGLPQTMITSKDPTQKKLGGNSEEVITVLSNKSQLDQLFQG